MLDINKLFVDDVRDAPEGWDLARTYDDAIRMLLEKEYEVLSLDHDLGCYDAMGNEQTGYGIALFLAEWKHYGEFVPSKILCHSANPVGRDKILKIVERYLK